MRSFLISLLLAVAGSFQVVAKNHDSVQAYVLASDVLGREGIKEMYTYCKLNDIAAPVIHSELFIKLLKADEKIEELEKRSFGLKLMRAINKWHSERFANSEHLEITVFMLDLRDWVLEGVGYGNYVIAVDLECRAAVSLAYLSVSEKYEIDEIIKLRDRFLSEDAERKIRISILNNESFGNFAVNGSEKNKDFDLEIERQWLRKISEADGLLDATKTSTTKDSWEQLPRNLAIFVREDIPATSSSKAVWNRNRHWGVAYSLRSVQVRNVLKMIHYREIVGSFPTDPPSWWVPRQGDDSPIRAAFSVAWEPFRKQGISPIYGIASRVFERVRDGSFVAESDYPREE